MKICILGNDKRSLKLRDLYIDGNEMSSVNSADIIIAPIPFSRDDIIINSSTTRIEELVKALRGTEKILFTGVVSDNMKQIFKENKIRYHDLYEYEEMAILNSIPTAEGAIQVAMEITDYTLHGSEILILGFGRITKILAKMLNGIGARVTCSARKQKDLASICSLGYNQVETNKIDEGINKYNIIFNTIPELILDEKILRLISKECKIIDLASAPGGVDYVVAKELGIDVRWELSIPTKVAPLSSARYIKETINRLMDGVIV